MYPIISDDMVKARQMAVANGYRTSRYAERGRPRGATKRRSTLKSIAWRISGRIRPQPVDQCTRGTAIGPSY